MKNRWNALFIIGSFLSLSSVFGAEKTNSTFDPKAHFQSYSGILCRAHNLLSNLRGNTSTMQKVKELMIIGRNFQTVPQPSWTPKDPLVTEKTKKGNCADKAFWLAFRINDFDNTQVVLGDLQPSYYTREWNIEVLRSKPPLKKHVWIRWRYQGSWWRLDCSRDREPILEDGEKETIYTAYYTVNHKGFILAQK